LYLIIKNAKNSIDVLEDAFKERLIQFK